MRILLLVHYYLPNIQSSGRLMHDLAVAFRDEGHEVIIATPEPELDVRREIRSEEGVTVVRVRSGRFRAVALPVRAYNEWRLSSVMWRGAHDFFRSHPCDLIVSYAPPIFLGPLVERLKRLWRSRHYLVLRDIFPQWGVDVGIIREGGVAHRVFRHYERLLYRTADVVGVQSLRNLDYFRRAGQSSEYRLEVLHNWAVAHGQELVTSTVRTDFALEGKVLFLYGGNLGVAQGASAIVRLAEAMHPYSEAFFLVVGEGSEAGRLREAAMDRRLDNIRFLPPVDQKTYLGLVAEADVGLITLRHDLMTHNFPGKMLDYMYFSKPILAAINPGNDLRDLIEEHDAGLVCWNEEDQELLECALRLLRDASVRRRCGQNGRVLLETRFSPDRAARQILFHG